MNIYGTCKKLLDDLTPGVRRLMPCAVMNGFLGGKLQESERISVVAIGKGPSKIEHIPDRKSE